MLLTYAIGHAEDLIRDSANLLIAVLADVSLCGRVNISQLVYLAGLTPPPSSATPELPRQHNLIRVVTLNFTRCRKFKKFDVA